MKYYATFSANNGSTYSEQYEYTNKAKAIKEIKNMVKGNHFLQKGNSSKYLVVDEQDSIVASGSINDEGRWSINHEEIGGKA